MSFIIFGNPGIALVEMNSMKMIFLAEFKMFMYDYLRIPFGIDLLYQILIILQAGFGFTEM